MLRCSTNILVLQEGCRLFEEASMFALCALFAYNEWAGKRVFNSLVQL